jgi:hypothetical protein
MHDMNNFKLIPKLTLIKYYHKHRLIITSNISTQISLIMLYNENIKREDLGQEKTSDFGTLQYYARYLLKINSASTLSASRITPPPPPPALGPLALNKSNGKGTTGG